MNKSEKIAGLATYITVSTLNDGMDYHHFTDTAPEELKDLFLKHYNIKDLDYEIFGRACDIMSEIFLDGNDSKENIITENVQDEIMERAHESASSYTAVRLAYLNNQNESEISDTMFDMGVNIADACAYWYDSQVGQAAILINEWINT